MAPIHLPFVPNSTSPSNSFAHTSTTSTKPTILHLGDPILYNHDLHSRLRFEFKIIRPDLSQLHRQEFIQHLKNKTWGDFSAIMRPFWHTGGEMGRWNRELIELLPRSMKVMASAGAGFDWVETDVLGEYGILYTNGAGASTESVADMALWQILSVFRQMTWSSLAARSNIPTEFQKAHQKVPFASHNPRGHTLGIVGLGNIGFAIAKKVRAALGMDILYYDTARKSAQQEDEAQARFYPELDPMLKVSDCVLLASPHGLPILNARTLSLLPRGACVVNIARGSLIDENALADALESKHISAAGLDVHTNEPRPNERLTEKWNVTLTCHNGGGTIETAEGFEKLAMENVEAVLTGHEPLTAVNKPFMRNDTNGINGGNVARGDINGDNYEHEPVNGHGDHDHNNSHDHDHDHDHDRDHDRDHDHGHNQRQNFNHGST